MPGSKYLWYRWTAAGKRYAMSLKTADLSEAITKIGDISRNLGQRSVRLPGPPSSLSKLVDSYLQYAQNRVKKPMRARTAKKKGYVLKKFLKDTSIVGVTDMTPGRIQGWLASIPGAETKHTYARDIKTFLRYCVAQNIGCPPILHEFDIPVRSSIGRKNWLKLDVANRVITNAKDLDLKFILFAGFHTGLRKSEILAAKVHWFDLGAGLLHVQNDVETGFMLKDRENRTVPLTKEFNDFLRGFLANADPNLYALRPLKQKGISEYRYDFDSLFKTHIRVCGVVCSVHDMRRSFASNLVSHGISVYKVAKWLGDGLGVVDRSYGHLAPMDSDVQVLGNKPVPKKARSRACSR